MNNVTNTNLKWLTAEFEVKVNAINSSKVSISESRMKKLIKTWLVTSWINFQRQKKIQILRNFFLLVFDVNDDFGRSVTYLPFFCNEILQILPKNLHSNPFSLWNRLIMLFKYLLYNNKTENSMFWATQLPTICGFNLQQNSENASKIWLKLWKLVVSFV